jgi:hypothetical protein
MDVLLRFAGRQNPSMARPTVLDDRWDSGERWPWRNGFCSNRNAASECSPAVWPACGCGFSSRPPTPLTGRGCDRSLQHRVLRPLSHHRQASRPWNATNPDRRTDDWPDAATETPGFHFVGARIHGGQGEGGGLDHCTNQEQRHDVLPTRPSQCPPVEYWHPIGPISSCSSNNCWPNRCSAAAGGNPHPNSPPNPNRLKSPQLTIDEHYLIQPVHQKKVLDKAERESRA